MRFLGSKWPTNAFAAGASPPDPAGGAYSAPPDPLAGLRDPILLREGKGEGEGGGTPHLCRGEMPSLELNNGSTET